MTEQPAQTLRVRCEWPGCERDAAQRDGRTGRSRKYCEQSDSPDDVANNPVHNAVNAFKLRKGGAPAGVDSGGQAEEDRPVTATSHTVSTRIGRMTQEFETLVAEVGNLRTELEQLGDPDAAVVEVESVESAANERIASAEARANRAEQAQRRAEAERGDADEAAEAALAQVERLEAARSEQDARLQELNGELTQARAELARQTGRAEQAEAERDTAQAETRNAVTRAETAEQAAADADRQRGEAQAAQARAEEHARDAETRATASAQRAEALSEQVEALRGELDTARAEVSDLRSRQATAVAERDAARHEVEAVRASERDHADQRVNELTGRYDAQVAQLRDDITAARGEATEQARRADRAEYDAEQLRRQLDELRKSKKGKADG